jgi:hypothetical protein
MGPREVPPELPHLEQNMLPESESSIRSIQRECNWMQALEGDIDTTHLGFLHLGAIPVEEATPGAFSYYALADRAPKHAVVDTDFGTMYGAYRPAEEDTTYWRIANFLFPFYTMTPVGVLGIGGSVRCWVPMDDDHTMFFMFSGGMNPGASVSPERRAAFNMGTMEPNSTGWLGRWRMTANADNDYQIDRESQKTNSYTGITAAARAALEMVLSGHEPYPALAVDRHWNLVLANRAAQRLLAGVSAELLQPPINVMRISLHPDGMARNIVNLDEIRSHLLHRLRRQVASSGDPVLAQLLRELSALPGAVSADDPFERYAGVVVTLRVRTPLGELSLFSTIAVFGTPNDVTLSELALESFFPADPPSADILRRMAEADA